MLFGFTRGASSLVPIESSRVEGENFVIFRCKPRQNDRSVTARCRRTYYCDVHGVPTNVRDSNNTYKWINNISIIRLSAYFFLYRVRGKSEIFIRKITIRFYRFRARQLYACESLFFTRVVNYFFIRFQSTNTSKRWNYIFRGRKKTRFIFFPVWIARESFA